MQKIKGILKSGQYDIHELTVREEEILQMSTGLEDGHPMSDEDIADVLMIRPEQVEEIRLRAEKKLKKNEKLSSH